MSEGGYEAIVLAGGAAKRLGGIDKVMAKVGGMSLLDRALAACANARSTVVVGPKRPVQRPVQWTRESPPGTGPLAAITAGLTTLPGDAAATVVLAADLPYVSPDTVTRLITALPEYDAAVLTDVDGRLQPLAAAYDSSAVREVLAALGDAANRPVHELLDQLRIVRVPDAYAARDCDTPEELESARTELEGAHDA